MQSREDEFEELKKKIIFHDGEPFFPIEKKAEQSSLQFERNEIDISKVIDSSEWCILVEKREEVAAEKEERGKPARELASTEASVREAEEKLKRAKAAAGVK